MNPVLKGVPIPERMKILRRERALRAKGDWPAWERIPIAPGQAGSGWLADIHEAHRNTIFTVLVRELPDGVIHLMVSSLSGDRPTFHEMQRIKDTLAGPEATAVEVYPPRSELIDEADAFHIWVLPGLFPHTISKPGPARQAMIEAAREAGPLRGRSAAQQSTAIAGAANGE